MQLQISQLKSWIAAKRERGIEPTADEIWNKIFKRWPRLNEDEKEKLFQSV